MLVNLKLFHFKRIFVVHLLEVFSLVVEFAEL